MSEGYKTKMFTKNLIQSQFLISADILQKVGDIYVPIGQDGVECKKEYTGEGLFFKLALIIKHQWTVF